MTGNVYYLFDFMCALYALKTFKFVLIFFRSRLKCVNKDKQL